MRTTYLILALVLNLFSQVQAQTFTPAQLENDFALFKNALSQVHPQMYRYTPKSAFDSLFTVTKAKLVRPMTQHEFYKTMIPLAVALRDGHIKWMPAGKDEHYPFFTEKLFPLKLYFVEKQAWIVTNYGETVVPAGAQVLSINGLPIASIVDSLLPNMTFGDGYTITGKYSDMNHFFPGYYATYFGPFDEFEVVYVEGTEEKTVKLAAVTEKTIKEIEEKQKPSAQKPFRLTFPENNTAVITIERFWDNKKEQDYKDFLKTSFKELKEKQIKHLVLDVRNNEGGNEPYGVELYSYLAEKSFRYYDHIAVAQKKKITVPVWMPKLYNPMRKLFVKKSDNGYVFTYPRGLKREKPKRNAFKGKVYVLINANSFSVTTEFAARVHADGRATFIGEETGGGYRTNSSGIFAVAQLPNTKIELGIPMLGFRMANVPDYIQYGQGIIPDHPVQPTITDVLTHTDPVMNFTLQLIKNQTSASKPTAGF